MTLRITNTLGLRLLQDVCHNFMAPAAVSANTQIVRHRRTKHWNPKWKLFRRLKVMPVELPKFQERVEDLPDEEVVKRLKEQGILPPRPWIERQYFIHSTGAIFEPYVPPEGDGKVSPVSKQGAMQSVQFLQKKTTTMMAIRKVRQFEEEFDTPQFCKDAEKIYIKMHEILASDDKENLIDYVTERAYPEVTHNIKNKTLRWKYIKELELPRVVQARCTDVVSKENIFAQITVRFHTQQTLAIYDRFGRLMHGSEIIAKDVLEYVVFEKHLANQYGTWRVHAKIIPDWLPPREPSSLTFKKIVEPVEETEVTVDKTSETKVIEGNKEGEKLSLA
ncbi:probable 39S ribosomal protein L45, mitochondrial [Diabrotica virgifera virgifera]|uniref:Large ribosomal subunit protein mL45 n=1 Tax=Diabrotica virgifera virgifera TaxID=50390 RepID=A0A6P7G7X7_DIAVI|nr:probable 39S ribosomal protein L45, mitochondrial [Diabrotica virgifera virgifera]